MNTEISTSNQQFSDPDIEALLDEFSAETQVLSLKGQQDGKNNKPDSESYWRTSIYNPLQNKVQEIIDTVQLKLQPIAGMVSQRTNAEAAQKKIKSILPEIDNENLKAFKEEQIMQSNQPNKVRMLWRKIVHITILILSILDGYLCYDALRGGHLSFLASFLYGCGIMLSLCVGSIALAAYVMKGTTPLKRNIRIVIGCALAAAIFSVLSTARANSYNNSNHVDLNTDATNVTLQDTSHVSSSVLFGISFGMFLVALFLSLRVHKTKEEEMQEQIYNDAKKAFDDAHRNIGVKTDQIEEIERNALAESIHCKQVYEYSEGCRKRAIGIAEHGLALYAKSNQLFRNDNQCPLFFSNPPQFILRSFLDQLKTT